VKKLGLLAVLLASGCGTYVMYTGPRRPAHEVATFVNEETALDMLDGVRLRHLHRQDGVRYEVQPGVHQLGISLLIVNPLPGFGADIERSDNQAIVCIDAVAGHTYVLSHEGIGEAWRPTILDDSTQKRVPFVPCYARASAAGGVPRGLEDAKKHEQAGQKDGHTHGQRDQQVGARARVGGGGEDRDVRDHEERELTHDPSAQY